MFTLLHILSLLPSHPHTPCPASYFFSSDLGTFALSFPPSSLSLPIIDSFWSSFLIDTDDAHWWWCCCRCYGHSLTVKRRVGVWGGQMITIQSCYKGKEEDAFESIDRFTLGHGLSECECERESVLCDAQQNTHTHVHIKCVWRLSLSCKLARQNVLITPWYWASVSQFSWRLQLDVAYFF